MKPLLKLAAGVVAIGVVIFISCKKELSCKNCKVINQPPIANAGNDTTITSPKDSILLDGSASADPDGTITSYKWARIAGPVSANIVKPDSSKTVVKALAAGVYQFELVVTDNGGLSAKDTVRIMVNAPGNQPPVACAGPDQIITLPTDTVTLDGSCSVDPDNNITSYVWTKIAGLAANISNANAVKTQVGGSLQGVYQFELKVTDAAGLFSKDTILITVKAANANSAQWTELQNLSSSEFWLGPRYWFGGGNFLMGIDDNLFAVSNKGNIWKYTTQTNSWGTIGTFPENMNDIPVTFSIGGRAYCMGGGHCWQYDLATNSWTKKTDPPSALTAPLVINNKAYLQSSNKHLIAYDPLTDSYVEKSNLPGLSNGILGFFVLAGEGYYVGNNGQLWKYAIQTDSWQQKASFSWVASISRTSSFSLNNYGYIIGDLNNAAYNAGQPMKLCQYDSSLDKWTLTTDDYPGQGAYEISTVSFNRIAYVGLGYNNGDFNAIDFWRFQ